MINWYNSKNQFCRSLIVTAIIVVLLPLVVWGVVELTWLFPAFMNGLAVALACVGLVAMFAFIIWMLVYMWMTV